MPTLKVLLFGVLGLALAISVVTDLSRHKIFDWVTGPTIALALGLRLWREGLGDLETGVISGLVGAFGASVIFALLAAWRKSFGWGDVKLLLAVGACLGYPLMLAAVAFVSLAGSLQAIVTLVWQGAVWDTLSHSLTSLGQKLKLIKAQQPVTPTTRHIPYGVAIALGSVWAMWWDGAGSN